MTIKSLPELLSTDEIAHSSQTGHTDFSSYAYAVIAKFDGLYKEFEAAALDYPAFYKNGRNIIKKNSKAALADFIKNGRNETMDLLEKKVEQFESVGRNAAKRDLENEIVEFRKNGREWIRKKLQKGIDSATKVREEYMKSIAFNNYQQDKAKYDEFTKNISCLEEQLSLDAIEKEYSFRIDRYMQELDSKTENLYIKRLADLKGKLEPESIDKICTEKEKKFEYNLRSDLIDAHYTRKKTALLKKAFAAYLSCYEMSRCTAIEFNGISRDVAAAFEIELLIPEIIEENYEGKMLPLLRDMTSVLTYLRSLDKDTTKNVESIMAEFIPDALKCYGTVLNELKSKNIDESLLKVEGENILNALAVRKNIEKGGTTLPFEYVPVNLVDYGSCSGSEDDED